MARQQIYSSASIGVPRFRRFVGFLMIVAVVLYWRFQPKLSVHQSTDVVPKQTTISAIGDGPRDNPLVTSGADSLATVQSLSNVSLPVLMYHYVREVPDPALDRLGFNLSVTPANFSAQLGYLATHSYQTVTPQEILDAWAGRQVLAEQSVLLTFDDGYADFYSTAYPLLKQYQMKATLYVVTNFVDRPEYVTWEQLHEMDRSGLITIGSHTLTHADLTKSSRASEEINQSKSILEERLGHSIQSFCYPAGRLTEAVARLVEESGYDLAFTTQPGATHAITERFALPRVRIEGNTTLESYMRKVDLD